MTAVYPDEKPARWQTDSGWRNLGWRVLPDATPVGTLKLSKRQKFPIYDYTSVEPIPGKKALERRVGFMLTYLHVVVMRQAKAWAEGRADMTDELIQDTAVTWYDQTFDGMFFVQEMGCIPLKTLADRVRFAFEHGAMAGQGRTYADYAYNEF